MKPYPEGHTPIAFALDPKLHENLKIRLHYDQIATNSQFYRMVAESYLAQDARFMAWFDEAKIEYKIQSKNRRNKAKNLRDKGDNLMKELALTERDIENIFDILEEDMPEL